MSLDLLLVVLMLFMMIDKYLDRQQMKKLKKELDDLRQKENPQITEGEQ